MRRTRPSIATLSSLLAASFALGGCVGSDGIELSGGVFDALGVSTKGEQTAAIPKVPERPGLVLPPNLRSLPTPGAGQAQQQELVTSGVWPVSPEVRRSAAEQQKEAEHIAFCKKELERKKLNNDLSYTDGPLGNCAPSVLTAIGVDPNKSLQQAQQNAQQAPADPARQPR
jgi:hypothetical protein